MIIGVVVVIAIIRAASGGLLFHQSVTLPDTLAGQSKITTGTAASTVESLKTKMEDQGIKGGDGAAYGTGTEPAYFVFAAPGDPDTLQELFDSSTSGASSSGLTFGPQTQKDVDGVSYLCADILHGTTPSGAICVWSSGNEGMVISGSAGIDATSATAAEAKAAI